MALPPWGSHIFDTAPHPLSPQLSPSYNNYHHSLHLKLARANLLANPPPPFAQPVSWASCIVNGENCADGEKIILFHCCIGSRYSTKSERVHVRMGLSRLWSVASQRTSFSTCVFCFILCNVFKSLSAFAASAPTEKTGRGPSHFTSHRWVNGKLSLLQTVRFVRRSIRTKDEEWYLYDLHSLSILILQCNDMSYSCD